MQYIELTLKRDSKIWKIKFKLKHLNIKLCTICMIKYLIQVFCNFQSQKNVQITKIKLYIYNPKS